MCFASEREPPYRRSQYQQASETVFDPDDDPDRFAGSISRNMSAVRAIRE
jgi:hypothetical protein